MCCGGESPGRNRRELEMQAPLLFLLTDTNAKKSVALEPTQRASGTLGGAFPPLKCKPKKLIKLARRRARIRRLKHYLKQKLDRGLQLKNGLQVLLASKTVIAVSTTNYSKLYKDFQSELIMHRSLRTCIFYTLK